MDEPRELKGVHYVGVVKAGPKKVGGRVVSTWIASCTCQWKGTATPAMEASMAEALEHSHVERRKEESEWQAPTSH